MRRGSAPSRSPQNALARTRITALTIALVIGWFGIPTIACAQDESRVEVPTGPEEEARQRFRQGLALAQAGNCAGAIAELEASFVLLPRPNTMFNIAQCQEELHRYDLALASYQRYLEMAPPEAPDRGSVERTMRTLSGLLGTIHVQSNVEAEVWIDDRVVGRAPGDVLVPGGSHVLELRAEGRLPERREVSVAARGRVELEVTLREATQVTVQEIEQHIEQRVEAPPLPVPVFVSGVALTLVSVGVGTGFGIAAINERDRQRGLPPALPRDPTTIDDQARLADIFLITGAVLGAGTIAIAFLTDFEGRANQVAVAPVATSNFVGVVAGGVL